LAIFTLTLTLLFASTRAFSQTETVIHAFQSLNKLDGFNPNASLIADTNGALYGTTATGGKYNFGTVFKLTPPAAPGGAWTESVLYSFTGDSDGGEPAGGPLLLKNGALYGTTYTGGAHQVGTVFELTPGKPWVETVIYSFLASSTGYYPSSGLTLGSKGALYGTTINGGAHSHGTVYRLSPPAVGATTWSEATIYSFKGGSTDGYEPKNNVILDNTGALYGTTVGGTGTAYKLTPSPSGPWTETVLYFFNGASDGDYPNSGLVIDSSGALYGATTGSFAVPGGNIYQLAPPGTQSGAWSENILYTFKGAVGNDGGNPNGAIFDSTGELWGSTELGGNNPVCGGLACGTIYKLTPPSTQGGAWMEQVEYSFQGGADGLFPDTQLLLVGSTFYGTTANGGGKASAGTVFSFAP
jgi:uncharacterized repeat protein (TIGR03803 family)